MYTVALTRLPPAPETSNQKDEYSLQRAILLSNRSAAFARLCCWSAAVDDARRAIVNQSDFTKARCQLGTALLGSGLHEEAYAEFAKACEDKDNHCAQKARKECLVELQFWRSL